MIEEKNDKVKATTEGNLLNFGSSLETSKFQGTASYYRRFRVPYPTSLIDSLSKALRLDGTGTMLDVGCGTGQVIEALGGKFEKVVGVDPDLEMLKEAATHLRDKGFSNCELRQMSAADISTFKEHFAAITFGASFHWTDRMKTATTTRKLLAPGGALILMGSNSTWKGKEPWQAIALKVIGDYLGEERRAGSGVFKEPEATHQQVLKESGFSNVTTFEISYPCIWTLDNFIGYLYSTSFASKAVLGDKAPRFEASLREALLEYNSSGEYPEAINFHYIYGINA